jgi:hypothetical protein
MDTGGRRQKNDQRDTGMVSLSTAGEIDAQFLKYRKQVTRKVDCRTVVIDKRI